MNIQVQQQDQSAAFATILESNVQIHNRLSALITQLQTHDDSAVLVEKLVAFQDTLESMEGKIDQMGKGILDNKELIIRRVKMLANRLVCGVVWYACCELNKG